MSNKVPEIFDRALRQQHLRRAYPHFNKADFLLRRMAQDMNERLLDVNRKFEKALIVTPHESVLDDITALTDKIQHVEIALSTPLDDRFLDEENPQLQKANYDLILSLNGLHCVNDLPGSLIQYHLALQPDGLFLSSFPGGETLTELRQSFMQAETETTGGVSPRIHPFADLQDMAALMQRAGFALPVVDYDRVTVRYEHALALLKDLRHMGETNCLKDRHRQPLKRQTLMRMAEIYQQSHQHDDGKIPATFDLIYLSGWAPHESQQKPLRPGSAKMRLADALGVEEKKI